jgi:hypothetical protein
MLCRRDVFNWKVISSGHEFFDTKYHTIHIFVCVTWYPSKMTYVGTIKPYASSPWMYKNLGFDSNSSWFMHQMVMQDHNRLYTTNLHFVISSNKIQSAKLYSDFSVGDFSTCTRMFEWEMDHSHLYFQRMLLLRNCSVLEYGGYVTIPCTYILPENSCVFLGNLPLLLVDYTGDLL